MQAKVQEILSSFRAYVEAHDYRKTPILTVYVDIDPTNPDNRKERPAWLIELGNERKKIRDALPEEELKRRASLEKWAAVEEYLTQHLRHRRPEGRSVVLFTDLEDYLVIDLPVSLPTRIYWGTPQLKHLLFALDMYEKYLTVVFGGAGADLHEVFLSRTVGAHSVEGSGPGPERGEKNLARERRELATERKQTREIAQEIEDHFRTDSDFRRIVFGGNLKQAHAVKNALHPSIANLVVAMEAMDARITDGEVAERVTAIANEVELENDRAVVRNLLEQFHAKGRAVVERQGVETALQEGRVRTLVLPYPVPSDEFDPLLIEATLGNAEIEFVYGDAAAKLAEFGGIGAFLYYAS
ncbi:MAG: hypothetical protein AAGD14_16445 [Planctomycetota bacterium]